MIRRLLALATLAAALLAVPATLASPAAHASVTPGNAALDWAEAHALGHWYGWGGTGPSVYDCSGLVMSSFAHAGIVLPHNTVAMVQSGRLHRTYHPQRGDVAVWGSPSAPYHIEFVTIWYRTTFGAHHTGLRIGWRSYGPGYMPSGFYEVR